MSNNRLIEAIRNASHMRPQKKKKVLEMAKRYERERKAKACVHFLTDVPNCKEGWDFINTMKKYLHKGRYSIRLKGRGSRKEHGNQSYIPLPYAERYSVYIDHKIKDSNSPGYNDSKLWKYEMKFRNIRGDLQAIRNQINEILYEDK
jgi:hypothetical protein